MQATYKRAIKNSPYLDALFPKPNGEDIVFDWEADLEDTKALIPKIIFSTLDDTKKIATVLKKESLSLTLESIWDFVYSHIQYTPDKKGIEQIRRPSRTWQDRFIGVDCEDMTIFIGSILVNLNIPLYCTIAKYTLENGFQHIYPIILKSKQKGLPTHQNRFKNYFTLDCVVDAFDYEEPFIEKQDILIDPEQKNNKNMQLHILNGIPTHAANSIDNSLDQDLVLSGNFDTEFSEFVASQNEIKGVDEIGKGKIKNFIKKVGSTAKTTLNKVNKFNPATALLRLGILASLKVNLLKVAGNLRYTYLDEAQAENLKLDNQKLAILRKIRSKLEDIFFGAGGKIENLKKAILQGNGNKDKAVNLSGLSGSEYLTFDINTPLSELLQGVWHDEIDVSNSNVASQNSLMGLGEPTTAAAIAAASSAMALIAGLIKQIGPLKKDGTNIESGESVDPNSASAANITISEDQSSTEQQKFNPLLNTNSNLNLPNTTNQNSNQNPNQNPNQNLNTQNPPTENAMNNNTSNNTNNNALAKTSTEEDDNFLNKAKTWVKEHPVQAGAAALFLATGIVFAVRHFSKPKSKTKSKSDGSLAGIKRRGKKKSSKSKKGKKKNYKGYSEKNYNKSYRASIALL